MPTHLLTPHRAALTACLASLVAACSQLPDIPGLTSPKDTTPPTVTSLDLDASAAYHGMGVTVQASATDDVGVTRYTFKLGDQTVCDGASPACTVTLPAGTATSFTVTVTARDAAKHETTVERTFPYATATARTGGLTLTEVGYDWLEVHNPLDTPQPLDAYQLRVHGSRTNEPHAFKLPAVVLPAHEYALIRGSSYSRSGYRTAPATARWIELQDSGVSITVIPSYSFAELLQGGKTVDFVSWGGDPQDPTTPGRWSTGLPAFDQGRSLARIGTRWTEVAYATPGGPNDVPAGARDDDSDGIPDSAEVPGGHYAGLDLYAMGARTGRPDIFVEIDTMASSDPAIDPPMTSFQPVVDAFAARNIGLHLDRGTRYAGTFDPAQFNLGNTANTVPYTDTFALSYDDGAASNLYDLKSRYFDPRRLPLFHYAVIGSVDPFGSRGVGELGANDLVLTVKGGKPADIPSLFMHELGHNLGLKHGGGDSMPMKPNYFSVMNYRYFCVTLTPKAGNCPIGYSDGSSADLDENHLDENAGIGRGPVFIDWNKNGVRDSDVALDLTFDKQLTVLSDFDDWAHLNLPFDTSYGVGVLSTGRRTSVITDDRQRAEP